MPRLNPDTRNSNFTAYYYSPGYSNFAARSYLSYTRDFHSVGTPNYSQRSQIKHGLPENEYNMKLTKRECYPLHRYRFFEYDPSQWDDYADVYSYVSGTFFADVSYDLYHSDESYNAALSNCIKKVKGMKVNVAQALAERQQTIDLFADAAGRIARAIIAMKHGNMKQGLRALGVKNPLSDGGKDLAKNWLALQYGVKPLFSDVFGAAEHLARKTVPPILKFKGKSAIGKSKLHYLSAGNPVVESTEVSYSSAVTVMLAYAIGSQSAREMSQLGVTDPLLLAWEVLPYSFVIDWFLPVGNYLESLNYDSGLTFMSGSVSYLSKNKWQVRSLPSVSTDSTGLQTKYYEGLLISSENVAVARVPLAAAPTPTLPKFKNPLNFTHAANALALLRVACR